MRKGARPGRFETQIRLVLVLVVVFLAALDLMNLVLLSRTGEAFESAEAGRAKARGRDVALALDSSALADPRAAGAESRIGASPLRRTALRFGILRLAVLDADGATVAASGPAPARATRFSDLDAADRASLTAGRAVAAPMAPASGGGDATITAFVPVLRSSGTLASVVEIQQEVPELGGLTAWFRVAVAVQAASVVVIGAVVLIFGRWVSRPYRQIAEAAGLAGLSPRGGEGAEPDDLVAAFRGVAEKLRAQESTVDALDREGGGLGDLVRFARGARSMATGVMVVDRRGRLAAANPAVGALIGLDAAALSGTDLEGLPRGLDPLKDLVRACVEEGRAASREVVELRAEGGGAAHVGVTISPVAGAAGSSRGALVLMTDLTEIRRVAEQVRLKENLAAVGELSAGIAHEFRNALGTILGYARMLEKSDQPRVNGPAREILKEVAAVRETIDEFLLYARPPEPQRAPIDLEEIVRSCAATPPAGATVAVSGEFATVVGDETLLKRVFANLVQNAADAGAAAGRAVSVRIQGRRTGHAVQVEVDDDGPGIPPEARPRIFLPFFTTRSRGTGLGLALVQRTVVDLGGTIEVAEGPRGGASFRIRIPLGAPPATA